MTDTAARQRQAYETLLRAGWDAPFIEERPALFSPAAAAQDDANPKGAFGRFAQLLLPQEYAHGWLAETQAHVQSAYLGDWTSLNKVTVRGRQALEFLSRLSIRDLTRFETGQVKHHVQLDEHGWVASEGILYRLGEQEFRYTAGSCDWLAWQFSQGDWDAEVTDISPETFIFGVQGPARCPSWSRPSARAFATSASTAPAPPRSAGCPCGCCAPGSPASSATSCTGRRTTPTRCGG